MRNRILYKAQITNPKTSQTFRDWTHASSFKQALRYLGIKYPYPTYLIDSVTDTSTGLSFTRDEWREATKYAKDN